jgi:hypothetical protein
MNVDAHRSGFCELEDSMRDALGGFSERITREHTIDIRLVKRPHPAAHVHAHDVDRWDHDYAAQ